MHFPFLPSSILLALALHGRVASAADDKPIDPCTVQSASGLFYDLRALSVLPVPEGKTPKKTDRKEDYHAKGYDIPYNFTLNICAPLVAKQDDLVGISKKLSHNASAYYEKGDQKFSIG
jgi:cation-dependent mannose-6-phosphate receptor